jgi:hypothetical protein
MESYEGLYALAALVSVLRVLVLPVVLARKTTAFAGWRLIAVAVFSFFACSYVGGIIYLVVRWAMKRAPKVEPVAWAAPGANTTS